MYIMQGIGRPNQLKPGSVPLPPYRAFAYGASPAAPKASRKNNRRASRRNNRKSRKNNRKH
jgi:hypothetical protein